MKLSLFTLVTLGSLTALAPFAQTNFAPAAAIGVSPNRIVISSNKRSAEASITNNSDKFVRYRIQLADQTMTTSGTMQQAEAFPYSAKEMVRFMPKIVNLEPGKRQTIRFLIVRPEQLADGDYHTHVLFDEIPLPPSTTPSSTITPGENKVSFDIGMSYSMGIPLVIEQGKINSSVELVSASLMHNASGTLTGLYATLKRQGNAEGQTRLKAEINGADVITPRIVRIYREADQVELSLPFTKGTDISKVQTVTLRQLPIESRKNSVEIKHLDVQ